MGRFASLKEPRGQASADFRIDGDEVVPHGWKLKGIGGLEFRFEILFPGHVAVDAVGLQGVSEFGRQPADVGLVACGAAPGEQVPGFHAPGRAGRGR